MAGAFLWDDKVAGALSITSLGVAPPAGMPLSNLRDPQPRLRTRFVANAASILVDFGATVAVEAVAVISTTLGTAATIRWQQGDTVGAYSFDTTVLSADTGDAAGGNAILLNSAGAPGRYMQIDIADPSASQIDIGRLVAGPVWRLSRAFAYGVQEGRLILDRRDRNPFTGAEFPVPALANPRATRFSLPLLAAAEVKGQHRAMLRAMGAAGDALWIPDTGLSRAEMNIRSVWGAVAEGGSEAMASRDSFIGSSRSFTITERV
jgi:hypothetical protein